MEKIFNTAFDACSSDAPTHRCAGKGESTVWQWSVMRRATLITFVLEDGPCLKLESFGVGVALSGLISRRFLSRQSTQTLSSSLGRSTWRASCSLCKAVNWWRRERTSASQISNPRKSADRVFVKNNSVGSNGHTVLCDYGLYLGRQTTPQVFRRLF